MSHCRVPSDTQQKREAMDQLGGDSIPRRGRKVAMFENLLDAVESPRLQHVTLLQGTKAYGMHLAQPIRVPASE